MATVAIAIEVDEKGAVTAFRQVTAEGQKMEQGLVRTGRQGNVVMTGVAKDTRQANDAAQLLGRTLGVQLPRELNRFLAHSKTIGPALAAAFNVAVVGGFAFAVVNLIGKIPELTEKIFDWTGSIKVNAEAAKQLSQVLSAHEKQIRELEKAYKLIGLEGSRQVAQAQANIREEIARVTADFNSAVLAAKALQKELTKPVVPFSLAEFRKELAGIFLQEDERQKELIDLDKRIQMLGAELRTLQAELRNTGKELAVTFSGEQTQKTIELADVTKQMSSHVAGLVAGFNGTAEAAKSAEQNIGRMNQQLAAVPDLDAKRRAARIAALNEIARIEAETAVAILPPWQQADAAIVASAQERVRQIEQDLRRAGASSEEIARASAAVWTATYAQMRERLADSLEGLFDDITSGNIGRRFLDNFKRLVFQMIAQWILGMNRMRAASSGAFGGGGGILGAIFGGLLGIPLGGFGGGVGPGGTPPFNPAAGTGLGISNLPIFSSTPSAVNALLGVPFSAGGAASRAAGGGGLLASLGANLPGLITGGAFGLSQLIGFGGPGRGLLSGTLLAGGLGSIFAITAGAGLGVGSLASLAAFFSSALGAATLGIGAVVGLLFGFLGARKRKKARLQIEAQVKRQAKAIEDAYNLHQLDYQSAIGQLEQLRQQGVDALRQAGVKDISRSRVGHVDHWVDLAIMHINATEAERQRRLGLQFGSSQFGGFNFASGPAISGRSNVIEFPSPGAGPGAGEGGFGGGLGGGRGFAPELPFELLRRSSAASSAGGVALSPGLARPQGPASTLMVERHFHIHTPDPGAFASWLRRGGIQIILAEEDRARREGAA